MSTPEMSEPIWSRPEPGTRNARFSREKIAAKAMEIADADGIDAVSMRRVATELGAGTMTLYHYVANKRELFELMHDAKMGELLVSEEELRKGWRPALRAIAVASLHVWRTHRWQNDERDRPPVFGPNGLRHFDQSLQAVYDTGLPLDRRMEIIGQVDDYVAGYAMSERDFTSTTAYEGWDERLEEFAAPVDVYLRSRVETGEYPHVEEFMGGDDFATTVRRLVQGSNPEERFHRGLDRLLDGIAREIKRDGAG